MKGKGMEQSPDIWTGSKASTHHQSHIASDMSVTVFIPFSSPQKAPS